MTMHFRSPRWEALGLKRPPAPENLPRDPQTRDILMHALGTSDPIDPVDTMLEQVADEIAIMAELTIDGPGKTLLGWARRIRMAVKLLQRSEARGPIEEDETDPLDPLGAKQGHLRKPEDWEKDEEDREEEKRKAQRRGAA
jgi:hypothetical protein